MTPKGLIYGGLEESWWAPDVIFPANGPRQPGFNFPGIAQWQVLLTEVRQRNPGDSADRSVPQDARFALEQDFAPRFTEFEKPQLKAIWNP